MVWQDIVLTIANILFGYALIPQVYYGFKNKRGEIIGQTSLITAIGLFASCIVFFSLNLFLSGIICTFNAIMWSLILIQRILYK